jgi:hypothetical protein
VALIVGCTGSELPVTGTGGSTGQTGGTVSTGGATTSGGNAQGGAATGGVTTASGGLPSGGKASGGTATGGTATGGKASGGTATGGKATGGSTTGGSGAIGTWISGYAATMYGNSSSGDCAGYSNFSDSTNISGGVCTWMTGALKVTIASYQSGVANNASYYGAPGDLASIWQGGLCTCPGGGTGDCTSAPSCNDEQLCAKCVAVKCDPNGSFTYSGTNHGTYCNTTTYVVVQIIDACPHNHPTNVASPIGWCTSRQANHIDLSCSGLAAISNLGTNIGQQGWLDVAVQVVDCSVGLGKHSL